LITLTPPESEECEKCANSKKRHSSQVSTPPSSPVIPEKRKPPANHETKISSKIKVELMSPASTQSTTSAHKTSTSNSNSSYTTANKKSKSSTTITASGKNSAVSGSDTKGLLNIKIKLDPQTNGISTTQNSKKSSNQVSSFTE